MSETSVAIDERQIQQATKDVIDRLAEFDDETRRRVFRRALGFFELDDAFRSSGTPRTTQSPRDKIPTQAALADGGAPHFAERAELPPKEFMFQKQPHTDVERIACLAYYLAHYRDTPQIKTIDLSKLNTEAAQFKFSNTAFAVVNATNAGFLVPTGKGAKQLSALGERYVEALPNRDSAKEIFASVRIRRGRKSVKNNADPK